MTNPRVIFRIHAVQRMFERHVSVNSVTRAVQSRDIVEDYSSEMPAPSRLLLGFQGKRAFHVVTSEDQQANQIIIVTVYLPHADKWSKDFMSRRL